MNHGGFGNSEGGRPGGRRSDSVAVIVAVNSTLRKVRNESLIKEHLPVLKVCGSSRIDNKKPCAQQQVRASTCAFPFWDL